MTEVKFYENVDDNLLKFAVIIAKSNGKWVFCKHKERDTYEVPGGHRETGEKIYETAKRELYEETGAVVYDIEPVCVYSVTADYNFDAAETFGMLYFAEIKEFENELHNEIEKIILTDRLVDKWTYPEIQPYLIEKYNNWIKNKQDNHGGDILEDRKIICFHNPDEINGYLSNWYLSDFKADGVNFSSMEQYMMYQKAVLFGDNITARQILQTDDAGKIKALGRKVSGYNDIIWNGTRQIIVYNGLLEKFRQNRELADLLLKTGGHILAECAVMDKIWGIGISMKNENRFDISKWKGQNLLGFALMEVRKKL